MILLDTHAWVWWADQSRKLSARARRAIDRTDQIGVSAISCWEVATLVRKGRLVLDREATVWIAQALALPSVVALDLSPQVAIVAGLLDGLHGDPADRIIVATALHHGATLVTKDTAIRSYETLTTVW